VGKKLNRSKPTYQTSQSRCHKILPLTIRHQSLKISDLYFQRHRAIAELGEMADDEL